MKKIIENNKILVYIIVLIIISYIPQIYILMYGGIESKISSKIMVFVMFLPAIITFFYLIISKEGLKSINWAIGKPIYLLYGALLPALFALIVSILISYFGWGEITHFELVENQVNIKKGGFILGKGYQSIPYFILNYFLSAIPFSLLNGSVAFGEELGWRGFLQKKLIDTKGLFWGIVILGLIWGFWHFPLIVNGYNHPDSPVLGAFVLFPLTTVFASFFLAWLTIKANSFWPAVLAHGSINTFLSYIVGGMNYGNNRVYADIFILFIWGIVAFFSYASIKKYLTQMEHS